MRTPLLLTLALLLGGSPLDAGKPPRLRATLSEPLLTALLDAAAPIEQSFKQRIGAGPFQTDTTITIVLTNPKVRIDERSINVTMNYHARDTSGVVDVRGVATPEIRITAIPKKRRLEARFVKFDIKLPGGIVLPVERYIQPIDMPGVWPLQFAVGGKRIAAETVAYRVTTEKGFVHIDGEATFKRGR